jgi:uncharacterized repeat protein (TIGR01451 family)/CSLREA domain-containing protein
MARLTARRSRWARGCVALILALLLVLALSDGAIQAADPPFVVNSTLDQADANTGDNICSSTPSGVCTLRAAVQQGQVSNRSISVPAGTFTLSLGQLVVAANRNMVLSGAGSGQTIIDGSNDSRIFDIHETAFAYISKVSIENGDAGNSEVFPGHMHGGGIHNHGTLVLVDSTLRFNSAYSGWNGGGMTNAGTGNATLVNVTVRTNYSVDGAGIENLGTLSVTNATIAWNSATSAGAGGGVFNSNGGKPVTIKNTIVTNNYSDGNLKNCSGLPASAANGNLASDATCGFPAFDSNVNVLLGGFDFDDHVYPLLPGSPAIDSGLNSGCPTKDQRGMTRPQDGNNNGVAVCDAGAYEVAGPDLKISFMSDSPDPVQVGDMLIYTIDVLNPGPNQLTSLQLTNTLPSDVTYTSFAETRGGSCAHAAGVVTCQLAALDGNRVWTIHLYTKVDTGATGTLNNQASVTSSASDPNPANNSASEQTTVTPPSGAPESLVYLPSVRR